MVQMSLNGLQGGSYDNDHMIIGTEAPLRRTSKLKTHAPETFGTLWQEVAHDFQNPRLENCHLFSLACCTW